MVELTNKALPQSLNKLFFLCSFICRWLQHILFIKIEQVNDFVFTLGFAIRPLHVVKLYRRLYHIPFGKKKGCLLLQFPYNITVNYFNKVQHILSLIKKLNFFLLDGEPMLNSSKPRGTLANLLKC